MTSFAAKSHESQLFLHQAILSRNRSRIAMKMSLRSMEDKVTLSWDSARTLRRQLRMHWRHWQRVSGRWASVLFWALQGTPDKSRTWCQAHGMPKCSWRCDILAHWQISKFELEQAHIVQNDTSHKVWYASLRETCISNAPSLSWADSSPDQCQDVSSCCRLWPCCFCLYADQRPIQPAKSDTHISSHIKIYYNLN